MWTNHLLGMADDLGPELYKPPVDRGLWMVWCSRPRTPHPGSYGAALSKSQDTVFVIVYGIFVLEVVAWSEFFDQIASSITTELLEDTIPCIYYTIIVLASIPTDERSKVAFVNGFLRWNQFISEGQIGRTLVWSKLSRTFLCLSISSSAQKSLFNWNEQRM